MRLLVHSIKPFAELQKCQISTSSVAYSRKIKRHWKSVFGDSKLLRLHRKIKPYEHPELFEGHMRRRQWDFPLGDDQRAEWKHKMWFDHFIRKWVSTKPNPRKSEFDIYDKSKRALIHEQDSIEMKFVLLLDKDRKKKYILPAFNMELPKNASYLYQYYTNTKFVHGLPYNVDSIKVEDSTVENFERFLTTMLQLELFYNPKTANEKNRKHRADRLLTGIFHHLMTFASHNDFLDCEVDRHPETSMFWQRGMGFYKYTRPDLPVTIQSHDTPLYQIRTQEPLPEFTPWMEDFMLSGDIPHCEYLPYVYGIEKKVYRNTISPGIRHKGGDVIMNYQEALDQGKLLELPPPTKNLCQYGHTQFISLPEKFSREWYESNLEHCDITDELEEHLKAHGIMSGWTWSAALAHYLGHWMDDDINKPMCVQNVISDGQYFSFFCYQLNTVAIDPINMESGNNQRRNICYGTPAMKLYDTVEGTDDIQLYRDATTLLLKFILNNSKNVTKNEDAVKHNASLEVQEWDKENPEIELQVPKHVRERKKALELARQEEIKQNEGIKDKIMNWIKS